MGIKFLDKTGAGAPLAGEVATREIVLDLKNGGIYSSTTGADLVKLGGDPEVGGVIYDNTVQYKAGDVVSYGDKIYIVGAVAPVPGTLPTAPAFSDVGPIETGAGGKAFDNSGIIYNLGDIVSENGFTYICTTAITDSSTVGEDPATGTHWTKALADTSQTNTEFDGTVDYVNGDLVTIGDDVYVVTNDALTVVGTTPPSAGWSLATPDERGGIIFDAAVDYLDGDVTSFGGTVYVAIGAIGAGGGNPDVNASWKDTTVAGVYRGLWDPTGATEYPDAAALPDNPNDYYIIDGVGSGATHLMAVAGADLVGTNVKDGDKFVVGAIPDDGTGLVGDWSYVPGPVIPAERGGIAYNSTITYLVGDVVSVGAIPYISIAGNVAHAFDPLEWTALPSEVEAGGIAWQDGYAYAANTTVVSGGILYTTTTAHTSLAADATNGEPGAGSVWTDAVIISNLDPGVY